MAYMLSTLERTVRSYVHKFGLLPDFVSSWTKYQFYGSFVTAYCQKTGCRIIMKFSVPFANDFSKALGPTLSLLKTDVSRRTRSGNDIIFHSRSKF